MADIIRLSATDDATSKSHGTGTTTTPETQPMNDPVLDTPVDARLAFLTCAAARLALVEAGEMDLDTAVADLVPPCACVRDVVDRWEMQYPPRRRK